MKNWKPSVLDVFAAPGGLSEGFRSAHYTVGGQLDSDHWGCETLRHNFGEDGTIIIEGDLRSLTISGHVDVVIGGPPCQSFSMVGRPKIAHLRKNGYYWQTWMVNFSGGYPNSNSCGSTPYTDAYPNSVLSSNTWTDQWSSSQYTSFDYSGC
ncbi:MAG: DNA cytosine methyltransferase [Nitrososphaerales archaeon]